MKFTEIIEIIQYKVSEISSAVVHVAVTIASTVKSIFDFVRKESPTVKNISDFMRKESPTYDNVVRAYTKSDEVRTIVNQAFLANLVKYALPVMAYEGYIRPSYVEGSAYESYIDYPIKLIFCSMSLCMFVNNTAYNISLSKSLTTFVPKPDVEHACQCIATSRISAGFSNAFHNVGIGLFVNVLYLLPKALEYFTGLRAGEQTEYAGSVAGAFAYGYVLVAMKYANHGICARHLRGLVNNNKVYCFMMGAAFLSMSRGGSYVLSGIAGSKDNPFIYDAIFSHLFHYFVMFNMLKAGTLTANKKAVDIFHYHRMLVDSVMRSRANRLVQHLGRQVGAPVVVPEEDKANRARPVRTPVYVQLPGGRNTRAHHLELKEGDGNQAQPVLRHSYAQLLNKCLNTRPMAYAASTTAISLLLSTHRQEIRQGLEAIVQTRDYPLWLVDYLPQYLTPQSLTILIKILEQQGWEDTKLLVASMINIALDARARAEVTVRLDGPIKPTVSLYEPSKPADINPVSVAVPIPVAPPNEVRLLKVTAPIKNDVPESKLVGEACLFGLFADDYFGSAAGQKKAEVRQEAGRPRSHSWTAEVELSQRVAVPAKFSSGSGDDFEIIDDYLTALPEDKHEASAKRPLLRSASFSR
jgi:hypothetical protein